MNRRDFLTRCWQTVLGFGIAVFGLKTASGKPDIADEISDEYKSPLAQMYRAINTNDICNEALSHIGRHDPTPVPTMEDMISGTSNDASYYVWYDENGCRRRSDDKMIMLKLSP